MSSDLDALLALVQPSESVFAAAGLAPVIPTAVVVANSQASASLEKSFSGEPKPGHRSHKRKAQRQTQCTRCAKYWGSQRLASARYCKSGPKSSSCRSLASYYAHRDEINARRRQRAAERRAAA
jgi:hypothetical protein